MDVETRRKYARAETRRKYAKQGNLIILLNLLPKSKWTEKDEYEDTLLHHACRDIRNLDAFMMMIKSELFDLNAPGQGNWTPLGICISHNILHYIQILCVLGCEKITKYTKGVFNFFKVSNNDITRFLISYGFRLNDRYGMSLVFFQNGIIKCRDVIVILLGLKKRRMILPKLDRFLIQQELAVAIWSTRSNALSL